MAQKHASKQSAQVEEPEEQAPKQDSKLADDVDEILEDIDGVLEENAEEFVRSYVQKGGQ